MENITSVQLDFLIVITLFSFAVCARLVGQDIARKNRINSRLEICRNREKEISGSK